MKKSGFAAGLLRYRLIILIIIALIVVVCVPGVFKLNISVDMEDFFVEDDPVHSNSSLFKELFNNNEFVGVLVESDDVFSRETLELIKETGILLQQNVPLAGDIVSLAETDNPFMEDSSLKFDKTILTSSDAEIERIRELYSGVPALDGVLFSKDFKQAWILLSLDHYPEYAEWSGDNEPQFAVGKAAWETVNSIDSGEIVLTATGVPVYAYRKEAEMMDDLFRVLIIGLIVALIVSTFIIRSVQGVSGAILVIATSVLSILGIQGWNGTSINSSFIAVPILLAMGVSIGYTVHISRFFTLRFRQTGKRSESILYALEKSSRPILFTAFTTIVALVSFIFVEIKPIQWVGITSAACIFAVYLLSISFFPILLSFGKDREIEEDIEPKRDWLEPLLQKCANLVNKKTRLISIIFLAAVVLTAAGISRLEVDFSAEKMMGTKLPHMQDQIHIGNSEIAASDTLEVVLSFHEGELKNPETLEKISLLEERMQELELVKGTSSLNTVVRAFNFLNHGWNPEYDKIPESAGSLRGLLSYFGRISPENLFSWVDEDYTHTRVFVELTEFSSKKIEAHIAEIEVLIAEIFPGDTGFFMAGSTAEMAVMNQYITKGLIKSVLIALLFISVLMIIVFRSVRIGLAAMIPNIFPVAVAGAIMGFTGMPLEFVTMTVAPMIMGLAVDDTIHLIFHLKNDIGKFGDLDTSIRNTFSTVGSAITETTIILCITFLVFTTSKVNSIINMGIISCCGMLAAYLSDIFVTPVIIRRLLFSKVKEKVS